MNKLTISSRLGKILFYIFNIIWYVPIVLSIFSISLHLPIYYPAITNRYDDVYYLQDSGMVAYSSSSGGGSIDIPNIYLLIASIMIILVFVVANLVMTYKKTHAKWFLLSILAIYAIFTIGLYSLELISF
jgi:hypothetical protein